MEAYTEKLAWCRANAPDAVKDLSDTEVLNLMSSTYERFCENKDPKCDMEMIVEDPKDDSIMSQLDTMVLVLSRLFVDRLAFKGGYMLSKIMPSVASQTTDIDFSIQSS